jgi:Flp pilus assembly protein TadB
VIALAAALMAAAAWLAVPPPLEQRVVRLAVGAAGAPAPARGPSFASGRSALAAGLLAGGGVWLLVGGPAGAILGVGCAVLVPRLTRNLESRAARERRQGLERQAPLTADLLAATLASGATVRDALDAVGAAVGEPTCGAVRPVVSAIDLGADPVVAWRSMAQVPAMAPLATAVVRSAESGAPLSAVLNRIAEDLRRERQAMVEVAARAAGVRAVAPLAACFLPAFLLMGVVPVVASLAGTLLEG